MVSKNHDKFFSIKKTLNSGFTLLELLVVIGIIALLSVVITVSLKDSRDKADDVALKQGLDQIRTLALIYKSDHGNFGAVSGVIDCGFNSGDLFVTKEMQNAIESTVKHSATGYLPICLSGDTKNSANLIANTWAVSFNLKSNPLQAWCIDSSGHYGIGFASMDGTNRTYCN